MTTENILRQDHMRLKQVNEAIAFLIFDKREKSQELLRKFQELRENLEISIDSNETALKLEKTMRHTGNRMLIVFEQTIN